MDRNTRSQPQKDQAQKPRDLMQSLAAILKLHNTIRANDAKRVLDTMRLPAFHRSGSFA
ncbi:MAG: hypothetical protein KDI69_10060 [Xanthomonadales bacterium]|nr:hypothetical protein [Xanthomonadales bacterium]